MDITLQPLLQPLPQPCLLGHHTQDPPPSHNPRHQMLDLLLLTSGGQHWRPVQSCSLQDPLPLGSDSWWPLKHVWFVSRWYASSWNALLPTAREGKVFTGVCLPTIDLMDTGSLLRLVTARLVCILLECFLVVNNISTLSLLRVVADSFRVSLSTNLGSSQDLSRVFGAFIISRHTLQCSGWWEFRFLNGPNQSASTKFIGEFV